MDSFPETPQSFPSRLNTSAKAKLWLRRGIMGIVGMIMLGILLVGGLILAVQQGKYGTLPEKEELGNIVHAQASQIYFSDGEMMGKYYLQNRSNVLLEEISPKLIEALIATEDVRFYEHEGIDWKSLRRVLVKSILLGDRSAGGGSTITQQLAKNLFPRERHGLLTMPVNKIKEMIVAYRLEKVYSKDEVLELYLNTVSFGEDVYGIGVATQRFFNTSPRGLTVAQSAALVGMLKATTRYNPVRNPELATVRRNVVLDQMVKYNFLATAEADSFKRDTLHTEYHNINIGVGPAPYFRQQVAEELKQWFEANPKPDGKAYNLYTDGLKIFTTLDAGMQEMAEAVVKKHLAALQEDFNTHWKGRKLWELSDSGLIRAMKQSNRYQSLKARGVSEKRIQEIFETPTPMRVWSWEGEVEREDMSPLDSLIYYNSFLHAGFMAMEPKTGYVRAWVGGGNFRQFKYDHVTSKRQVGSTFKPLIYAAALSNDSLSPCDYIANEKKVYTQYKNWSPGNSDGKYEGYYSMKGGLTHSVNTVSSEVIMRVGVDRAANFAQQFGFEDRLPHEPSLVLGTADLSVKEMVGAYSAFANRGIRTLPIYISRIEDENGNTIANFSTQADQKRVMDAVHADIMVQMLSSVVENGTASRLRRTYRISPSIQIGGKTGTTQNQTDGWFMGFTPYDKQRKATGLVVGVWVGGEDRQVRFRSLRLGQGANTALPIYGLFLEELSKESKYRKYLSGRFPELGVSALQSLDCAMYSLEDPNELKRLEDIWDRIRQNWEGNRQERIDQGRPVLFPPRKRQSKTLPDDFPPRRETKRPSSRKKKNRSRRKKKKSKKLEW